MCQPIFVFIFTFSNPKGKIISKGLFSVLEFSQKLVVVKMNSFFQFFGEFENNKSPFEIM